jgi:predicted metalloendopeptidase
MANTVHISADDDTAQRRLGWAPRPRLLQFTLTNGRIGLIFQRFVMNRPWSALAAGMCLLSATGGFAADPPAAPSETVTTAADTSFSGVDLTALDRGVRPQDDFYRFVNGNWLSGTAVPADKSRYGAFDKLRDDSQNQLRTIVEELPHRQEGGDGDEQKIADFYRSFMDEATLERLDFQPLAGELARVDALRSKADIPALIAHFNLIGVPAPFDPEVHQDARDSTRYVFDVDQSGLGMPDRDYYLQRDRKLVQMRAQYQSYVEHLLSMSGDRSAHRDAKRILKLETQLAQAQWSKVETRDPVKTYNKFELTKLAGLAPHYDWNSYLSAAGVAGKIDYLIISQPSYVAGFDQVLRHSSLASWKAYFRWHLLNGYAPYLSKRFVDAHFAMYGTGIRGVEQNQARWKRGIVVIEESMGEALGRLYVARYFPAESKLRMQQLVHNLIAAYREDLGRLDWMSAPTRQRALEKLAKMGIKIGYPDKWRDYSSLEIRPDDLVGNITRANLFESRREIDKLGHPIDPTEWDMTPQTVNAYYNPERNEIVFPAAILQPPFFDPKADDAVNYGGIGAVIGHEISHAFDDRGSQYDGNGNLLTEPGWFTSADLQQFRARTAALVAQYSAFAPVPGYPINGRLTLGENIADNSGLAIAYKAYHLSLGEQQPAVIDGLTGDQRFYVGWAQVWRSKTRENEAIMRIKSDPHSPDQIRGTVPEMNQDTFYTAFDVRPGDKMYLPPEKRVRLW